MFGNAKPVQQISLDGCPTCGRAPVISGEHPLPNGKSFQWVACPECKRGVRVYDGDYAAWNRVIEACPALLVQVVE